MTDKPKITVTGYGHGPNGPHGPYMTAAAISTEMTNKPDNFVTYSGNYVSEGNIFQVRPMTTMRERLIQRICGLRKLTVTAEGFCSTAERLYPEAAEQIVDVLLAELRTPTEAMKRAGLAERHDDLAASIFTAMIDAIGAERPGIGLSIPILSDTEVQALADGE